MPKKIAIILPSLAGGGAERLHINLAYRFIELNFEIDFVLFEKKGKLINLVPQKAKIYSFNAKKLRNGFFPLVNYINQQNPDSILAALWPVTVMTIFASKLCKYKSRVVVSEHNQISSTPMYTSGYNERLIPLSMKLLYPFADAVVGVSNGVVRDLRNLSNSSITNFITIYNPAAPAPEKIKEIKINVEFWNSKTSKKVIGIGSLKEQKDFPNLLRAFKNVSESKQSELLILGEGDEREKIEQLIRKYGLENQVHLPGFVQEPLQYLKSADLFVLSSAWEGFGNVIVEALACGVPVVSTDCKSGPREILDDGEYGNLVPVGDPEALASGILQALEEEHDPEKLRKRAQYFSVERAADEYLKLLFPEKVQ